jgi:hypothetical protein
MRFASLLVAVASSTLVVACSAASDNAGPSDAAFTRLEGSSYGGALLTATLLGANEVPTLGDPDGSGTARVTINSGRGELCYELTVTGIEPATMAHIHVGAAGVAGGVRVTLAAPTSGTSSGCVPVTKTLAKAILENPAGYYVNVHNAPYPGGALRGQLVAAED